MDTMRRKHEPIAQDPQPDLSARFEGLSLPELITRAVLEFPDGVGIIDSRGRIQFTNSSLESPRSKLPRSEEVEKRMWRTALWMGRYISNRC